MACSDAASEDDAEGDPALTEPRLTFDLDGVALPEGVAAGDLVVRLVEPEGEEPQESEGESRTLAAFRLEPDGLVFAGPVGVTVELPASVAPPGSGVTFVLVLTSGDGSSEVLAIEDARRDPVSGAIRLVTSVAHFSELRVISVYSPIAADLTPAPGEDFAVGSSFTVSAVVHRPQAEAENLQTRVAFSDGTRRDVPMRLSSNPGVWSTRTWWVVNDGSRDGFDQFIRTPRSSVVAVSPVETDAVFRTHPAEAGPRRRSARNFAACVPGPSASSSTPGWISPARRR